MKDRCHALFFTEEELANHEIFCHSEHPLGGGDSSEVNQTDTKTSTGWVEEVVVMSKEPAEEGDVYKTMIKMSCELFDEFLGKVRAFEGGVGSRDEGKE
jgi:hypothetical protein